MLYKTLGAPVASRPVTRGRKGERSQAARLRVHLSGRVSMQASFSLQ